MVRARACVEHVGASLFGCHGPVRAVRAFIALTLDKRHFDGSAKDRVQLNFHLQGVDQRLGGFADSPLPRDVERLRVVIQGLEYLEQVASQAFYVALGHGAASFRLGYAGG